jgi:imidazolonepropionase-like amidohydrolase
MTLDVFTDDVFGGNQLAGNAVANGMDWSAPLHAITQVLAEIFGLQAGRIEVGDSATLVLWNGDPLEVTTRAEAGMVDGEWIDAASRQTRLFERYQDLHAGKARGFTYQ